jgi:signal transduction histidine kinase
MLRTTHELKAPFAAIHANAQLMLEGYCGELPGEAVKVARRISARCHRLAGEIQEMLQLANLDSAGQHAPHSTVVDLPEAIRWCLGQLQARALERNVTIETDILPARIFAVEDHVKMLLGNVISNAMSYSHPGGRVRVGCAPQPDRDILVTVSDEGIGIAPEKLPKIFDEYYRTGEALRHNSESSGLGLAIVRRVAQANGIAVRVQSQLDTGTTFELRFAPARSSRRATRVQEKEDGLLADRG